MFKSYISLVFLIWLLSYQDSEAQARQHKLKHIDANDGLSDNEVNCFLKDSSGFVWIGTANGLNRFDGHSIKSFLHNSNDSTSLLDNGVSKICETPDGRLMVNTNRGPDLYDPEKENFEPDIKAFYKTYNLPAGLIKDIVKDDQENFWFVHETKGLIKYNSGNHHSIQVVHDSSQSESIISNSITSFAKDLDKKSFWVIHSNGYLERISEVNGGISVVYRNDFLFKLNKGLPLEYKIIIDQDGDLWTFVVRGKDQGAYYFDTKQFYFRHFSRKSFPGALNTNIVRDISYDDTGLIWIGTDHGGINIVDKKDFSVAYLKHVDGDNQSLLQNSIYALYKDDSGILWIGTHKMGVSFYYPHMNRFPSYKKNSLDPSSLPFDDVNCFTEDTKGNLWIGTNGGGLIYFDRQHETFKQFLHDPENPKSLSNDVIVSLCIDHQEKLWIGTFLGGLNCYDGKKFIRFLHDSLNTNTLSDLSAWDVFEDSKQRLWIGTLSAGVDLLDRGTNTFSHFKSYEPNSIHPNSINAIMEDSDGDIWFASQDGVEVLSKKNSRFTFLSNVPGDKNSLVNNHVFDIKEDKQGRIWLGTLGGLNYFNKSTKKFISYTTEDGLPHNSVLGILIDDNGNLWLSTQNGICNAIIEGEPERNIKLTFRTYGEGDGLQGRRFNKNANYKTRLGELIFGGAKGFNIFKPAQIKLNKISPRVFLTDFKIYNKRINVGEEVDGKILFSKSLDRTDHIILPYNQNVFSIEFAALDYFQPQRVLYRYKLEGFHTKWINTDTKSKEVTFTNLDPGDYTLKIKAANHDGFWNPHETTLKVTILPPFWKTLPAIVVYIILVFLLLLLTKRLIEHREKQKFRIKQERLEVMRMHELDMMKIKFFTNVSHEFRTPLTLILAPVEKLVKQTKSSDHKKQLHLIQQNAKRLLNLVNQLLDFRKLEVQHVKLNLSEGDLIKFLQEITYSFSDLSEKKEIVLNFNSNVESLVTLFDADKVEKIVFNLLSNAFKFTPEGGKISVEVENTAEEKIIIIVKDTGIGIPDEKRDRIFEPFFQNDLPGTLLNQGSGIGLSITKEFVKLHHGNISVRSEPGQGSSFILELPIQEVLHHTGTPELTATHVEDEYFARDSSLSRRVKPTVLIVEDNEDFSFYLKDNLKQAYRIYEARNGNEGWQNALLNLPDVIVTDIMMPGMNGLQLCNKIKSDPRTSHIPIIILTARTDDEHKLEGYETGADEYLSKPFNFEILASRIRYHILQLEKFQKAIPKQIVVRSADIAIDSPEEKFISRAIKCVEENLSRPDFSVEDLSRELGMGRTLFYKKMVQLTGKSPIEFIRLIRLQQAAQLLEKSRLTVSEIAYQVGFNNPKYFAKYFKEEYSMLPSEFAFNNRIKK